YREKPSSAGKFPGGFFKREGRPTTKEILTMRVTDRPIRPLFPAGYNQDLQIYANVLSFDGDSDADIPSIIGASAALMVSDIPFKGPIGAVRMGHVDGEFVTNPIQSQYETSRLNLVVCGRRGNLAMVEGEAEEVPEALIVEALERGQTVIDELIAMQEELVERVSVPEKDFSEEKGDEALVAAVSDAARNRIIEALRTEGKFPRRQAQRAVRDDVQANFVPEDLPEAETKEKEKAFRAAFDEVLHRCHREVILSGKRVDGRDYTTVRPIQSEVGILPRTHGSALFTRGETQALAMLTLGSIGNEQRIEGLGVEYTKKFLLHYNFPSFSVRETKPIRGPGRREIGHGDLAERSVSPILPEWEAFPYTLRIVSDILESNGSSSMATVCGASMALMDGGVPIARPVAGIAMGLLMEEGKTCILSDILGDEDHHGDMDFKVAGTRDGVTGLQMDIKVDGISREILEKALEQAREGRLHILGEMGKTLESPRPELSPYAPRIAMLMVDPEKIGKIIGPGGKMIKKIQSEMNVEIDVEDDGRVSIAGLDPEGMTRAQAYIEGLLATAEIGETYEGKVTSIKDFGAFVEILPGTEGLVHISEMGADYVASVRDVVNEGETVKVKVINIDDAGKVKLTMRLDESPEDAARRRGSRDSGGRPRRGGGRDRRGGGGDRGPRRGGGDRDRRRDGRRPPRRD
ncbi:MAG: polyribonucleotide nucleotidyltransferase, partial [Planctomycetota bacterium]